MRAESTDPSVALRLQFPRRGIPRMAITTSKAAIATGLIGAVMVYMGVAAARSGWVYSLTVDQFMASSRQAERVRLTGVVGNLTLRPSGADFSLAGTSASVPVTYGGVVPELLKPGCEAVVEGNLRAGIFEADTLLTRCASKYDPLSEARERVR